jgi:lipopolysaccharide biosynthesis protein
MSEEKVSSPGICAKILVAPSIALKGADVCLFVAYCPDGKVGSGLQYFLQKFVEQDIKVVLCLIVEAEDVAVNVADLPMCSSVLVRRNVGYDFGAWAGTLRTLPQLWEAKRLFFVNDSILGPNKNFGSLVEKIRGSSEDFIALTANWIDVYHAQSYFYVYQNNALRNNAIRKFWWELPDLPSKVQVIQECEQYQLELFRSVNLSSKIMFSMSGVLAELSAKKRQKFNPTHDAWRELLAEGFPFMKSDLFYKTGHDISGWGLYFQETNAEKQVTEILASRLSVSSSSLRHNHSSLSAIKFIIGEQCFFELRRRWKKWKAMRRIRAMYCHDRKQASEKRTELNK